MNPSSDLQTARDLRAAADYLRTHGWNQGSWGQHDGPRCIAGALLSASGDRALTPYLAAMGFNATADDVLRGTKPDFGPWNDDPNRTLAEVLDRLESAALNLEIRALAASDKPAEPQPAQGLEVMVNA